MSSHTPGGALGGDRPAGSAPPRMTRIAADRVALARNGDAAVARSIF